jgi:hypothetical protein
MAVSETYFQSLVREPRADLHSWQPPDAGQSGHIHPGLASGGTDVCELADLILGVSSCPFMIAMGTGEDSNPHDKKACVTATAQLVP